jgi:hypothetical protein
VSDNLAANLLNKSKLAIDSSTLYSKKAKGEKVQSKKMGYEISAKQCKISSEQYIKEGKVKSASAEADYNKVIELSPDYLDAYYNLGALTNNKSTEIAEKINAINISGLTQQEYDKKVAVFKKVQDSVLNVALGYFTKALEIAEAKSDDTPEKEKEKNSYMADILFSVQQVYANLGDEKRAVEAKKRRSQYEK